MSEPDIIDGVITVESLEAQRTQLAKIADVNQAQDAGYFLRVLRQNIRAIKSDYLERRREPNLELKRIKTEEERRLRPFVQAETQIDNALIAWRIADKRRVEEENRARLEAAREDERQKREADIASLNAQAASSKGLNKSILKAQARALSQAPLTPNVVGPIATETKIQGVPLSEYWHAEVDDLALLVQAVAQGRVPLAALKADTTWLNVQAAAHRKELSYPGVRAVCEYGQTARSL